MDNAAFAPEKHLPQKPKMVLEGCVLKMGEKPL